MQDNFTNIKLRKKDMIIIMHMNFVYREIENVKYVLLPLSNNQVRRPQHHQSHLHNFAYFIN